MTGSNVTPQHPARETKTCTRCGELKLCSNDHFALSKTGRFGFASACKICQRAARAESAKANPERFRAYARKSYQRNLESIKSRVKTRKRLDPAYALRLRVSSLVRQSLNTKRLGASWADLLGFNTEELRTHLESLFTEGMTWDGLLRGEIEIDHIIPTSFFNPSAPKSLEFRMCWNLKNLQPLWRRDNRVKGDALPSNFTEVWNELYQEAVK